MKVICIYGKHESGKTETIRMIHNLLKEKGKVLLHQPNGEDFASVIQLGEKRVGIISVGDSKDDIEKGYEIIKDFNCTIIIRAARSRGETKKIVFEKTADILWIKKPSLEISNRKINVAFKDCSDKINEQTAVYVVTEIYENS